MPRLRSLLGALALLICVSAVAGSATASAGSSRRSAKFVPRATQAHSRSVRRRRKRPAAHCAKPSSFHVSGGHVHHKRHSPNCAKRGHGNENGNGAPGAGSHHSTGDKRTGHHAKHGSSNGKPADADTCPGADLRPAQENIEAVRAATLCLVNKERTNHGEATLQPNADLQQSAQGHTESMVSDDYFEHDGPGSDTPLSRMTACGYIYSAHIGYEIGENIGWGTLSLSTPRAIVAAWMASPGHRANILDVHFRDTAVGVSPRVPSSLGEGQAGGIYTQDFGVIITG